jgi:preprotein translocase subunit SecG
VLTKATTICAILFMLTSLGLALYGSHRGGSVLEQVPIQAPPAEPAPAAAAPTNAAPTAGGEGQPAAGAAEAAPGEQQPQAPAEPEKK